MIWTTTFNPRGFLALQHEIRRVEHMQPGQKDAHVGAVLPVVLMSTIVFAPFAKALTWQRPVPPVSASAPKPPTSTSLPPTPWRVHNSA